MKAKRSKSSVIIFVLFFVLSLIVKNIEAYQPIVSIGKPNLIDICYTPDGRFLATLTSNYVEFLDAETMLSVFRINTSGSEYSHIAISPNSSLMAIPGWEKGIQVWDIPTKTLITTIPAKTNIAEFSPDGKYLAYNVLDSVFLWDIEQKMVVMELTGDPQPQLGNVDLLSVYSIAFHPNSKILAVGSTRSTIALWDIETGKIISHLEIGYEAYADNIHFSHDGTLLVAITARVLSGEDSIKLWNISTGDSQFIGVSDPLATDDVSFTVDDSYLLIGEGNGELRIVNLATFESEKRQAIDSLPPPEWHNFNRLSNLTFHPDGKIFACQFNNSKIYTWNIQNFSKLQVCYGWGQSSADAVYLPEINRIVTGADTNEIYFWDAKTGELLSISEFHQPIQMLKGSPDGKKVALSGYDQKVRIWDAVDMKELFSFMVEGPTSRALGFSPSGKYLGRTGWNGTHVWDMDIGKETNLVHTGYPKYPVLVFTPDEKEIIVIPEADNIENEKIAFFDINTSKRIRDYDRAGPIVSIGDDYIQASRTTDGVEVILLKSNRLLCKIPAKPEFMDDWFIRNYLKFNPSGSILAVTYYFTKYEFYDAWTGELITTLNDVNDFCFTNNGKHIFLSDSKNGLGLYQLSDILGKPIPTAINPSGIEITTWGRVKQNRLLQNYPNPFNPETWIPYQLENDADVVIKIYSSSGQLVRTLNLGRKSAGLYLDKEIAVYWDGRDDSGRRVASGLYFYSLEAGKFIDTKKMIIIK
jgi:WD40 repeat protein